MTETNHVEALPHASEPEPLAIAVGAAAPVADPAPRTLPLDARHRALGARMVPFAGYLMPIQYPAGIIAEHLQTREAAGLFDVSHMGQGFLVGPDHDAVSRALESLVPADILGLAPGRQRYTQFLDAQGGILDDLMVARSAEEDGVLMLVVNASNKAADWAHVESCLPAGIRLIRADHRALIALQGPKAAEVLGRHVPEAAGMAFMDSRAATFDGISCQVSRSGYTGEDGYEISVHERRAGAVWDALVADDGVKPIGLGARDSLRLEAGLPLHGHDIDPATDPVEAGLGWSIQKRRRTEGGFPGAETVQARFSEGVPRRRVGLVLDGRAPAREGAVIALPDGAIVGRVTSGGFGPSVQGPVAMGYVASEHAEVGTPLAILVRGRPLPARVAPLPFVPHRYHRG